jgi:hypothetical protein
MCLLSRDIYSKPDIFTFTVVHCATKGFCPPALIFSDLRTFWLVGVHTSPNSPTSPTKTVEEINALKDVHDALIRDKGAEDVMIMGDLNAGCRYVTRKQLPDLAIRTSQYHWLIGDNVDTTVAGSGCPYDR